MAKELILFDVEHKIATLTLNRPHVLNALNLEMWEMLDACFSELEAMGDEVRALILTGAGEKAFCAGLDLSPDNPIVWEMLSTANYTRRDQIANEINRLRDTFNVLAELPFPTIAALNGLTFGAGLEMAMCCDLRLAVEGARFCLPEVAVGVIPDMGGTQRLPRLVGLAKAKEMILTGLPVDTAEALRIGLVNQVVSREYLPEVTRSVATRIASMSPIAVRASKRALNQSQTLPLSEGFAFENQMALEAILSEDLAEGIRAFREKRPPAFRGC
ncbi:MAG: enoyl-CoA hydratase/isomerase family protein [Blastocatellia bacterium]|nr:enoyl-CoA hydratase/isomerase family protein [Blastocatellia bacterium]